MKGTSSRGWQRLKNGLVVALDVAPLALALDGTALLFGLRAPLHRTPGGLGGLAQLRGRLQPFPQQLAQALQGELAVLVLGPMLGNSNP